MHRGLQLALRWSAVLAAATACSNPSEPASPPTTSTATTQMSPTPDVWGGDGARVLIDCGQDGVANASIEFGKVHEEILVGGDPETLAAGGVATYERVFGVFDPPAAVPLVVTTVPTRGTCTTTLSNGINGEVLAKETSSEEVTLTVVIKRGVPLN